MHTDERETVSSPLGTVNPLIAVEVSNGLMKRSLVLVLVRLSTKSNEIGSEFTEFSENRSMAES